MTHTPEHENHSKEKSFGNHLFSASHGNQSSTHARLTIHLRHSTSVSSATSRDLQAGQATDIMICTGGRGVFDADHPPLHSAEENTYF